MPSQTPSMVAHERSKRYNDSQNATVANATKSSRCQINLRNRPYE